MAGLASFSFMKGELPSQVNSVDTPNVLEKEVVQASWSLVQGLDANAMPIAHCREL